jgi:uncharacterized protein YjbJ (UPF0337 family)
MSIKDRADAAAQNLEGKGQEAVGKVTGSSQDEATGKAKQAAANVRDGIEDAKDKIADKANEVAGNVRDGIEHAKNELKNK